MNDTNLNQILMPDRMVSLPPIKEESSTVLIYADSSCLNNGTEHAQAGVGVVITTGEQKRIKLKACYLGGLTNHKAEILACAIGLESLKVPSQVRMFSNSKYVVETIKGHNRMKSNREFWNRLVSACLTHNIEWNRISRHAGDAFQETADRLSRAAAFAKENLNKNMIDRLASMLLDKPDEDTIKMIHNGLKTLATICDGAKIADRQGFDKFDSELGHHFAKKSVLSVSEALIARKLLTKYRGQISKFDEELALIV